MTQEDKALNLVEILKDYPEGTVLYSSIYGEVKFAGFAGITPEYNYPIQVKTDNAGIKCFTKDGRLFINLGECVLFPSKDQRDWNVWKTEQESRNPFKVGDHVYLDSINDILVIEKIIDNTNCVVKFLDGTKSFERSIDNLIKIDKYPMEAFKPFHKVLVSSVQGWRIDLYSHYNQTKRLFVSVGNTTSKCIPYNIETEHLLGTYELEVPKFYINWEK